MHSYAKGVSKSITKRGKRTNRETKTSEMEHHSRWFESASKEWKKFRRHCHEVMWWHRITRGKLPCLKAEALVDTVGSIVDRDEEGGCSVASARIGVDVDPSEAKALHGEARGSDHRSRDEDHPWGDSKVQAYDED